MIAITLSVLLFIKYIFFDKSETYAIPPSLKNSPPPKSPPGKPPATRCPFTLPESRSSSVTVSGQGSPSTDKLLSATRGSRLPQSMEKLVTEGIVVDAGLEKHALPAPGQQGSGPGTLTRTKSSSQLLQPLETSRPQESSPHADMRLEPAQSVSVTTQTDMGWSLPGGAIFTVGGAELDSRKHSVAESESSGIASLASELPPVPRQLEECMRILKSDVSLVLTLQ